MAGKFELHHDQRGGPRSRTEPGNRQIVAGGGASTTEQVTLDAIEPIRRDDADARPDDRTG